LRTYNDLDDLPKYNWDKLNKTGDLSFLLKYKPKFKILKDSELEGVWEKMNDEFIMTHGLTDDHILLLKLKKDFILARAEGMVFGNLQKEMEADLLEVRINNIMQQSEGGVTDMELLDILEEVKGYPVDTKKISVNRFYSMVNNLAKKNGNKQNNQPNN